MPQYDEQEGYDPNVKFQVTVVDTIPSSKRVAIQKLAKKKDGSVSAWAKRVVMEAFERESNYDNFAESLPPVET